MNKYSYTLNIYSYIYFYIIYYAYFQIYYLKILKNMSLYVWRIQVICFKATLMDFKLKIK